MAEQLETVTIEKKHCWVLTRKYVGGTIASNTIANLSLGRQVVQDMAEEDLDEFDPDWRKSGS